MADPKLDWDTLMEIGEVLKKDLGKVSGQPLPKELAELVEELKRKVGRCVPPAETINGTP